MSESLIDLLEELRIAHDMSHAPFCDGYAWRDTFVEKHEQALAITKKHPTPDGTSIEQLETERSKARRNNDNYTEAAFDKAIDIVRTNSTPDRGMPSWAEDLGNGMWGGVPPSEISVKGAAAPDGVLSREEDRQKTCPAPTQQPDQIPYETLDRVANALHAKLYYLGQWGMDIKRDFIPRQDLLDLAKAAIAAMPERESPQPDDCKAAFERFHASRFGWEITRPEHYADVRVQERWQTWQAAWSLRPMMRESVALRPMKEAPRDGQVILAFYTDFSGVLPIRWGVYDIDPSKEGWFDWDWGDEACGDDHYAGWIPTPQLPAWNIVKPRRG